MQLIQQFGAEKVHYALAPLITKCKWNDWLCVSTAVDRLARRAERQHQPKTGEAMMSHASPRRQRPARAVGAIGLSQPSLLALPALQLHELRVPIGDMGPYSLMIRGSGAGWQTVRPAPPAR